MSKYIKKVYIDPHSLEKKPFVCSRKNGKKCTIEFPQGNTSCMIQLGGVKGEILYQLFEFEMATCRTWRVRSKKAILEVATSRGWGEKKCTGPNF